MSPEALLAGLFLYLGLLFLLACLRAVWPAITMLGFSTMPSSLTRAS